MSRKSAASAGVALPDAAHADGPLTVSQIGFACMLGAVLAAAWTAEPSRTVRPAPQPNSPTARSKKTKNFPERP